MNELENNQLKNFLSNVDLSNSIIGWSRENLEIYFQIRITPVISTAFAFFILYLPR